MASSGGSEEQGGGKSPKRRKRENPQRQAHHVELTKLEGAGFNRNDLRARIPTEHVWLGATTAVGYFCAKVDLPMVQWLFANGAAEDITSRSSYGHTPFEITCFIGRRGCFELARWLHSVAANDIDLDDVSHIGGQTPLIMAIRKCDEAIEFVEWLLDQGVDTRQLCQQDGQTAFHAAAEAAHLRILKMLLEEQENDARERRLFRGMRITEEYFKGSVGPKLFAGINSFTGNTIPAEAVEHEIDQLWIAMEIETATTDLAAVSRKGGETPMKLVCRPNYIGMVVDTEIPARIATAQWLFHNGALTGADDGHVSRDLVRRDMRHPHTNFPFPDIRPALLDWARELVATQRVYFHVVLPGMCSARTSAFLWRVNALDNEASTALRTLIADYVGVEQGRSLRSIREFETFLGEIDMDDEGPISDDEDDDEDDDDDDDDDDALLFNQDAQDMAQEPDQEPSDVVNLT
jgi:hypothetical protein